MPTKSPAPRSGAAGKSPPKGIQSVEIGCEMLMHLSRSRQPASLTLLAAELAMSPSKAYFYLTSLVRSGLVSRDDAGLYKLGRAAREIGFAALSQIDAIDEAREAMVRIQRDIDQSINMSVWGTAGPTVVHRLPAPYWRLEIRLGAVLSPLTATGRSLLTGFPESVVSEIIRDALAKATSADPWRQFSQKKAMSIFLEDRERGLSRGFGSVFPGATSLAAPFRDQNGNTVAAITIQGEGERFDTSYDGPVAKALLAAVSPATPPHVTVPDT
ncbi:MAG: IclR family transcriptional regulator [Hyphomicrobiales bacterium]|nr:IclR family transcriptional regulator [Hyphomicrobiales bacterium]